VALAKVVIGHVETLGESQEVLLFGAHVGLMVETLRVVHLAIQTGKDAMGAVMAMVRMHAHFRTTVTQFAGQQGLCRKCRGASQQIMVEATSTGCAQNQRTRWI